MADDPLRVVFMGTPEFAAPSLERLVADGYTIVGVYTQADRPAGRSGSPVPSPVKRAALGHGLPVFQPRSLRRPQEQEEALERASWSAHVEAAAMACRCCPECREPPCDGALAGGICDQGSCRCDDTGNGSDARGD